MVPYTWTLSLGQGIKMRSANNPPFVVGSLTFYSLTYSLYLLMTWGRISSVLMMGEDLGGTLVR